MASAYCILHIAHFCICKKKGGTEKESLQGQAMKKKKDERKRKSLLDWRNGEDEKVEFKIKKNRKKNEIQEYAFEED